MLYKEGVRVNTLFLFFRGVIFAYARSFLASHSLSWLRADFSGSGEEGEGLEMNDFFNLRNEFEMSLCCVYIYLKGARGVCKLITRRSQM